jgi:YD repeat-containing protein
MFSSWKAARLAASLALFFALTGVHRALADDITYTYDAQNRITSATDNSTPSGSNSVSYTYDAASNITSIKLGSVTTTAVYSVDPPQAQVGSQITIYGDGFGNSPGQDVVNFTGANSAQIISSEVGKIVVVVPVNAQTGTIAVSSQNGTATSPSFTVTQ